MSKPASGAVGAASTKRFLWVGVLCAAHGSLLVLVQHAASLHIVLLGNLPKTTWITGNTQR